MKRFLCLLFLGVLVWPRSAYSQDQSKKPALALVGGRVIPGAGAVPIPEGTVLVRGDVIEAVGPAGEVPVPANSERLDCRGATVLPAFWNTHVHLGGIASRPRNLGDARLNAIFREAFLRWGFVYAFEPYASSLAGTRELQHRISSGAVVGPTVFTTGEGFAPANSPPSYLLMPPRDLPTIGLAGARVSQRLDEDVDGIKLFTGSITPDGIVVMPTEIVAAATALAHARETPVFAHPSNSEGARAAVEGGVDILAHAFPRDDPQSEWDEDLIALMIQRKVAMIPTLQVYRNRPSWVHRAIEQLRRFAEAGGEVLFGTDLRSPADIQPSREYELMLRAGMSFQEILRSLTIAPARRFGLSEKTGQLQAGMLADIVVVNGNPTSDPTVLGSVRFTLRDGEVVFRESDRVAPASEHDAPIFSRPVRAPFMAPRFLDHPSIPYDRIDLDAYVGTYRVGDEANPELVTVSIDDGVLRVAPSVNDINHLVPLGDHVFAQGLYRDGELLKIYWPAIRFVFEMANGRAIAYQLRSGEVVYERGIRVR